MGTKTSYKTIMNDY